MKKALITGITGQDGAYLAEFLLKKLTGQWIAPEGMSKMDRFIYVDDEDFDADAFLDSLGTGMEQHLNRFEKEWMGE